MNKSWLWSGAIVACLVLLVSIVHANDKPDTPQVIQLASPYPSLNRVHYRVSREQWVSSDTARVLVSVNANLTDSALDHFQDKMNKSLNSLAKDTTWHVTQFNRNQDNSGLEQVSAVAEARIANSDLAGLRTKAEKLSEPGTKYTITDIQYGPSDEDIEHAKEILREKVYAAIADEMKSLRKTYSQDFFVNSIDFDMSPPMPVAPMAYRMEAVASNGPSDARVPVNQKLILQADVVLAATVK